PRESGHLDAHDRRGRRRAVGAGDGRTGDLMQVVAVPALPQFDETVDLARTVADATSQMRWPDGSTGLADGDILVVSSKIVSKVEGQWADDRDAAVSADTVRT